MSKQTRLEALKLAVQAGGGVDLASTFTDYIENGLAKEPEVSDDATPANQRRARRAEE